MLVIILAIIFKYLNQIIKFQEVQKDLKENVEQKQQQQQQQQQKQIKNNLQISFQSINNLII